MPSKHLRYQSVPEISGYFCRVGKRARSALLDDRTLYRATDVAVDGGQLRRRNAGAVGADPAFRIQQDPAADRRSRQADRKIGIAEKRNGAAPRPGYDPRASTA